MLFLYAEVQKRPKGGGEYEPSNELCALETLEFEPDSEHQWSSSGTRSSLLTVLRAGTRLGKRQRPRLQGECRA